MAKNYDNIDARWVSGGDYSIQDGDLEDTSSNYILSIQQDLQTICASSLLDWENYPSLGATLDDFIGEPNNQRTADAVYNRLHISILSAGIVAEEDLVIRTVPVHANKLLIIIGVNVVPTEFNSLNAGDKLVVSFIFDTLEQEMFFLDKTPQLLP